MPNIKSARKRLRQNIKHQIRNRGHMRTMRTAVKRFRRTLADGDVDGTKAILNDTYSRIDKTRKLGLIHPNKAARLKSRLAASIRRAST